MKNKLVGYCFLASIIMSCQEDDIGYNLDTEFRFEMHNTNGESLLNPANSDAFEAHQIDIYYLIEGEKRKVYNGNYDLPENFSIGVDELTDRYVMTLGPNENPNESTSITFIEWNEDDIDTVACEFAIGKHYMVTTRITYNSQEVWSVNGANYPERRYFTITK
ncbi:MAG: hypothetical protein AAF944_14105 [Bacteroidota bacterium]